MPETAQRFTCSGCGKGYRWRADIAGQLATCKQCQRDLVVPDSPGVAAQAAPASAAPAVPVSHLPTPGISPILRALESREDEIHPANWREWYLPAALAVLGLVWMTVVAWYWDDTWLWRSAMLGILLGSAIITVPILFTALMITAQIARMSFGQAVPGLVKLTGVAFFGSVAADLIFVTFAPLMLILGYYGIVGAVGTLFATNLFLVALPLWILFELDLQEFGITAVAIFVLKAAILSIVLAIIMTA